jgi:hypothetical protein
MSLHRVSLFSIGNQSLLRLAAFLVPRRLRSEWSREWRSELWHVRQERSAEGPFCWHTEQEITDFCLGAFQDALCLRQQSAPTVAPLSRRFASPAQCLLLLATIAAAVYGTAQLLPGVQSAVLVSPYRVPRHLMLISQSSPAAEGPTITAAQFRAWQARRQSLFSTFAFYQPVRHTIEIAPHRIEGWTIARSSANLLDLLELPHRVSESTLPQLVLSDQAWKRYFGNDPHAVGRVLRMGDREVQVAAIIPAVQWNLPGNVDAWLQEPDDRAHAIPDAAKGFLIGQLNPLNRHAPFTTQWSMIASTVSGQPEYFTCILLSSRSSSTFSLFLFMVLLACIALPATTSIPLGEYPDAHHKLARATRFRRWIFLVSKFALIAPTVYYLSLDLAYMSGSMHAETSQYIQIISSFAACLFALRWALRDQRQRCPVCLGRLSNPARVGHPSRNFLAWSGTELICVGGHGLLHVPEIPTSWFGTQRWLYLDPSWEVLFPETPLASPGSL